MDAVKLMGGIVRQTAEYTKEADSLGCAKLVVFAMRRMTIRLWQGRFHGVDGKR